MIIKKEVVDSKGRIISFSAEVVPDQVGRGEVPLRAFGKAVYPEK